MADDKIHDLPAATAMRWLNEFEKALESDDLACVKQLFTDEAVWRDMVAFTWNLRQAVGVAEIERLLDTVLTDIRPAKFSLSEKHPAPSVIEPSPGAESIEVFFGFETVAGRCSGYARLIPDDSVPAGARSWSLLTRLDDLHGHEYSQQRPEGQGFAATAPQITWRENRETQRSYADRDPVVLIVGGGHSGLMVAAHLKQLDVDALIVDKNEHVGDNWRKRYASLALHTPTDMCHFPYMPFPETFPEYLSKDKLANWLETYVASLDLNYWTATEYLGGTYRQDQGKWDVTVRTPDGTERRMRPAHVIMATGGAGVEPNIPKLPGLGDFQGELVHSTRFPGGAGYAGKNALVVGTGTSAHDIAFDLYNNGAKSVTMLQRGRTTVVDIDSANLAYGAYFEGIPTENVDIRFSADFVYPLLIKNLQAYTQMTNERDKKLHERLEEAGMRLDNGADDTGWLMKFLRYGGGYYLNVGASDAIINGGITILQRDDIDAFTADGLRVNDGRTRNLDLIVLATGFQSQTTEAANYYDAETVQRVGEIAGFDEDGELRNLWRPTGQHGIWFMYGSLQQARLHSRLLALQIKADLEGIIPEGLRQGF